MGCLQSRDLAFGPGVSSFSGLPVADVLTLTSGDRLVKQPNDVIVREVEVTHRLRRGIVVTGDDCIAIETDEVFLFRAHRRSLQVRRVSLVGAALWWAAWRAGANHAHGKIRWLLHR